MADEEQLAILRQGAVVWNRWRQEHPEIRPNLFGQDLMPVSLEGAILSGADLRQTMLAFKNLDGQDLERADLSGAILQDAHLRGTNLKGAILRGTDLNGADLSQAMLDEADLREADLGGTNLSEASLIGTTLSGAQLRETDLNYAKTSRTVFGNLALAAKGLETIKHLGPSTIGIDTIYHARGYLPEIFLRGAGVPDAAIAFSVSLRGKPLFNSCFISHSAKDLRFCEKLHTDLQTKGVRVWLFEEDAKWGESVWGVIDRSIKLYDKLIIVLSENSLQSGPVLREIERALIREDKEGKNILFPIRIDDYIFTHWEHERKADVLRKVVGDFSGWDKDATEYDKAFERLVSGLQAESRKA